MKYVIEFGNRHGIHTDNQIVSTLKQATTLASTLVNIFTDRQTCTPDKWVIPKGKARMIWQTDQNFVAISKLDGVWRGPASSKLWRHNDLPTDTITPQ